MKKITKIISKLANPILYFLQVSTATLFWSGCIALIFALLSFPIWNAIFTERNLSVAVQLSAPGVEIVRAYWDDPKSHPDAYESIIVQPLESQQWQVEIEALGENNPNARGFEVAVLDIKTSQMQVDWSQANFTGNWEMRDSIGSPQGKAAIAHSNDPDYPSQPGQIQSLSVPIEGGDLEIEIFAHRGSGKAKITINNTVREIDFYRRSGRHEMLKFPAFTAGDRMIRDYTIQAVDTPWRKIRFIPEGIGEVNIKSVRLRNQTLVREEKNQFILPWKFWNRWTCSIMATFLSFCMMLILFISSVHIWQGQPRKWLGIWSYKIVLSLTLSGFWMLVYYPAIMSADSLNQWSQALSNHYDDWHPPIMTLGMRSTLWVTDSPALFAFIQGFCLYFSVYLFIDLLLQSQKIRSRLQLLCFTLVPLIPTLWNYSVTLWKDVWLCTSFLLMLFSLLKSKETKKTAWFILYLILFGLSISLRTSAIFYFPFFAFESFVYLKQKLRFQTIAVIAIALFSIFVPLGFPQGINYLANANETHQEGKAILYDIIGTYLHTNPPRPDSFQEFFTPLANDTKTTSYERLKQFYSPISGDDYVWHQDAIFNYQKVEDNRTKILQFLLFKSILQHPIAYLRHKSQVWDYLLGFRGPQYPYDYGILKGNDLGLEENFKLSKIQEWTVGFILPGLDSFFLPKDFIYLVALLSIFSHIIQRIRKIKQVVKVKYFTPSVFLAGSLIASFMFITPVVNFRYLFASCIILICLSLVEFFAIVQNLYLALFQKY